MSPHNVLHAAPLEARSRAFLPPTLLSILPRLRLLLQTSTQLQSMSQSLATYAFCVPPPHAACLLRLVVAKAQKDVLCHIVHVSDPHTLSHSPFMLLYPPLSCFVFFAPFACRSSKHLLMPATLPATSPFVLVFPSPSLPSRSTGSAGLALRLLFRPARTFSLVKPALSSLVRLGALEHTCYSRSRSRSSSSFCLCCCSCCCLNR